MFSFVRNVRTSYVYITKEKITSAQRYICLFVGFFDAYEISNARHKGKKRKGTVLYRTGGLTTFELIHNTKKRQ
jgi:hypothetical protein